MGRVVFLLEERSIKTLLNGLLPVLFPDLCFLCISHEGKNDLERSIPRKLRAWNNQGGRFVIVRDNDGSDCIALKHRLRLLCQGTGHEDALVRIVCQELEAWYLGDPVALAKAFGNNNLRRIARQPRFRNPDARAKPSTDMRRLCPEYQKISGARRMAEWLTGDANGSASFNVFIDGIDRLARCVAGDMADADPA